MKKLLLISMLIGALPFTMQAQDDDLYFVPKKKSVEKSVVETNVSQPVTYTDSSRSIDEYNRRMVSSYQVIDGDTIKTDSLKSDIIYFSEEKGVYPDSLKEEKEDFELTKKMSRFDDYQLADNAAFWAGYQAGLDTWAWHSPWYYSRYGWYGGWYDPWYSPYYYTSWRYGWYDPWYYGYGYYGWYDPWYYGYYGYPYYYGWYYPYWGGGYISGASSYAHNHIGTGTIRSDGSTHAHRHGGAIAGNSERTGSLRDRASRMSGGRTYSSGNNDRSRSGNFSGYRGNSNTSTSGSRSNSSYNTGSRSSSNSSFGGSRSSGGGSFSGGSSGGSRGGGGGGGSRLGGRR